MADYNNGHAFLGGDVENGEIIVPFKFETKNPVGEVWIPFARYANLEGASIKWTFTFQANVGAPDWHDVGAQAIIRTNNEHNIEAKQYESWVNLQLPCDPCVVRGDPTMLANRYPTNSYTDMGLNTSRSVGIGLKLDFEKSLRDVTSVGGLLRVKNVEVTVADAETQVRAKRTIEEQERQRIAAAHAVWSQEISSGWPSQTRTEGSSAPTHLLPKGDALVLEKDTAGRPRGFRVSIRFPEIAGTTASSESRVQFDLASPLDVTNNALRVSCAVSPGLQGVLARTNRLRWVLHDVDGHVAEGPALSVSEGVWGQPPSAWFPVEFAPVLSVPTAMGYMEEGFRPFVSQAELVLFLGRGAREVAPQGSVFEGELACTLPEVGARSPLERAPAAAAPPSPAKVTGVQRKFMRDLDALVARVAAHGRFALIPVLFDFYTWNGIGRQQFRTWSFDERGAVTDEHGHLMVKEFEKSWNEGEHVEWVRSPEHQRALLELGIRPILRRLLELNRKYPGVVRAIDLGNEPDNATAVVNERDFDAFVGLFERLSSVAHDEIAAARARGMLDDVGTTIGFRRAEDYLKFWRPRIERWKDKPSFVQVHYYDDMAMHDGVTLLAPWTARIPAAAQARTQDFLDTVGRRSLFIGEAEGHSVADYIQGAARLGSLGVAFWQLRAADRNDDGFLPELDALASCLSPLPPDRGAWGSWDGVNLPWLNYGRDFGVDEYDRMHVGMSVSSSKRWLDGLLGRVIDPLLEKRASAGARTAILRVFVGTDWRTGLCPFGRPNNDCPG